MFLVRTHPVARGIKIGSNQPPQWQSVPTPSFVLGVASNFPPSGTYQSNGYVTDADGGTPAITWVSGSVSGVTWDGGKFVYDGLGSAGTTGSLVLRASDGTDTVDSATFSIVIESNLAWSATPSVSFVEASVTPTNLGAYVTNYNASTDEFRITPSYSLPTWLSLTTGPGTGSGNLTPNGNQVDANDVSASPGIKIDVRRSGGAWVSSAAFGVTVTAIQAAVGSIDDLAFEGRAPIAPWTDPQRGNTGGLSTGKHANHQYCPEDGKFYTHGGDGGYPGFSDSGSVHSWRMTLNAAKNAVTFDLFYPYYGISGEAMPGGAGCNAWTWDSLRKCFWSPGGFFEGQDYFWVTEGPPFTQATRLAQLNVLWRWWHPNSTYPGAIPGKWEVVSTTAALHGEGQSGVYHAVTDSLIWQQSNSSRLYWYHCATGATGFVESGRTPIVNSVITHNPCVIDTETNELISQEIGTYGHIWAISLNGWHPISNNTARTARDLWGEFEAGGLSSGFAQRPLFIRGSGANRKLYLFGAPFGSIDEPNNIVSITKAVTPTVTIEGQPQYQQIFAGAFVHFSSMTGMTQLNGVRAKVLSVTQSPRAFVMDHDTTGYGTFLSGSVQGTGGNGLGFYELNLTTGEMNQGAQPYFHLMSGRTAPYKPVAVNEGAYSPAADVLMATDHYEAGAGSVPLLFKWSPPTWTPAAGNVGAITIDSQGVAVNNLNSVAPAPGYSASGDGQQSGHGVVGAWGSACYARTLSTNGVMLFWNGGDADGWGNHVMGFDFDSRKFYRLTDPKPIAGVPNGTFGSHPYDSERSPSDPLYFNISELEHGPEVGEYGWGLLPVGTEPAVGHNYDSIEWIPGNWIGNRRGALVSAFQTTTYTTNSSLRAHYFDIDQYVYGETRKWGRLSTNKPAFGSTSTNKCVYDEAAGRIYHNWGYLDLNTKQQNTSVLFGALNFGYHCSACFDPIARLILIVNADAASIRVVSVGPAGSPPTQTAWDLTFTGDPMWAAYQSQYGALEYCPNLDCFFFYNQSGIGGAGTYTPQTIWKIEKPAVLTNPWNVTRVLNMPGVTVALGLDGNGNQIRGNFGRFRWIPPLKCFAFLNSALGPMYLYKPEGV